MDSSHKGTVLQIFAAHFAVTLNKLLINSRVAGDLRRHDDHVTPPVMDRDIDVGGGDDDEEEGEEEEEEDGEGEEEDTSND